MGNTLVRASVVLAICAGLALVGFQGCDLFESTESGGSTALADADFLMLAPYSNVSEMAPINEAYDEVGNSPWGFTHNGVDFFSIGGQATFQAVCPGEIDWINLFLNPGNGRWQVNVAISYNSRFSVEYAFEPTPADQAGGQAQLAAISVIEGQTVAAGDTLGVLIAGDSMSHVHFGLRDNNNDVCPSPYFTEAAAVEILGLLLQQWPGASICY